MLACCWDVASTRVRSTHEPPPCCLSHPACTLSENKITNTNVCSIISLPQHSVLSKLGDRGHEWKKKLQKLKCYHSFLLSVHCHHTSAYRWWYKWLCGLDMMSSSMQKEALAYSCSCRYRSHSSIHAS